MDNTATLLIVVAVSAVAIMVIGIIVSQSRALLGRAELKQLFGPEDDRAVEEFGGPGARTRRTRAELSS